MAQNIYYDFTMTRNPNPNIHYDFLPSNYSSMLAVHSIKGQRYTDSGWVGHYQIYQSGAGHVIHWSPYGCPATGSQYFIDYMG